MEKERQSIYLTCQRGATRVLKEEMARRHPAFRFSFSRPGFLTYLISGEGVTSGAAMRDILALRTVFARARTLGLGKVVGKTSGEPVGMAREVWHVAAAVERLGLKVTDIKNVHVWEPDREDCGRTGFEPGLTPLAQEVRNLIIRTAPAGIWDESTNGVSPKFSSEARRGDLCLDCVLVSPDQWWLGVHHVSDFHSRFPGGLMPFVKPDNAVSRAWLKFEEGLRWANFPIDPESQCVDIGSSPGGCCQVLLARGARVLGVDPADMAPELLADPRFEHIRNRINQVRRRTFRHSRWFFTDMNVAPSYTLGTLEELVMRSDINARGLLFTLKLLNWELANYIPDYIRRVESWGFNKIKVRQLQYNRQEIMMAALKKPFTK
ncbi:MAG: SAM-dependent methyltransferase [Planctomycetia bacterium]|nr:SAM-dependent methyltransferase [Planctomycetia bacterium]